MEKSWKILKVRRVCCRWGKRCLLSGNFGKAPRMSVCRIDYNGTWIYSAVDARMAAENCKARSCYCMQLLAEETSCRVASVDLDCHRTAYLKMFFCDTILRSTIII